MCMYRYLAFLLVSLCAHLPPALPFSFYIHGDQHSQFHIHRDLRLEAKGHILQVKYISSVSDCSLSKLVVLVDL